MTDNKVVCISKAHRDDICKKRIKTFRQNSVPDKMEIKDIFLQIFVFLFFSHSHIPKPNAHIKVINTSCITTWMILIHISCM